LSVTTEKYELTIPAILKPSSSSCTSTESGNTPLSNQELLQAPEFVGLTVSLALTQAAPFAAAPSIGTRS